MIHPIILDVGWDYFPSLSQQILFYGISWKDQRCSWYFPESSLSNLFGKNAITFLDENFDEKKSLNFILMGVEWSFTPSFFIHVLVPVHIYNYPSLTFTPLNVISLLKTVSESRPLLSINFNKNRTLAWKKTFHKSAFTKNSPFLLNVIEMNQYSILVTEQLDYWIN